MGKKWQLAEYGPSAAIYFHISPCIMSSGEISNNIIA
jgi:hypothetical protein